MVQCEHKYKGNKETNLLIPLPTDSPGILIAIGSALGGVAVKFIDYIIKKQFSKVDEMTEFRKELRDQATHLAKDLASATKERYALLEEHIILKGKVYLIEEKNKELDERHKECRSELAILTKTVERLGLTMLPKPEGN